MDLNLNENKVAGGDSHHGKENGKLLLRKKLKK
jgi:hypothetical protein